jgi:hypothetical protein
MSGFLEPEIITALNTPFDEAWVKGVAERLDQQFEGQREIQVRLEDRLNRRIIVIDPKSYTRQIVLECWGEAVMNYRSPFLAKTIVEGIYTGVCTTYKATSRLTRSKWVVTVYPNGARRLEIADQFGHTELAGPQAGAYYNPPYFYLEDGFHIWHGNGVIITPEAAPSLEEYMERGIALGLIPLTGDGVKWI